MAFKESTDFAALIYIKLTPFQQHCVETPCTKFHLNRARNMESKVEVIGGLLSLAVIEAAVTKRILAGQLVLKNYIEFLEDLTHG
jgi:hypothetical protein